MEYGLVTSLADTSRMRRSRADLQYDLRPISHTQSQLINSRHQDEEGRGAGAREGWPLAVSDPRSRRMLGQWQNDTGPLPYKEEKANFDCAPNPLDCHHHHHHHCGCMRAYSARVIPVGRVRQTVKREGVKPCLSWLGCRLHITPRWAEEWDILRGKGFLIVMLDTS
jgi:hypothetical protein